MVTLSAVEYAAYPADDSKPPAKVSAEVDAFVPLVGAN